MLASLHFIDDGFRGTSRARALTRIARAAPQLRHLEYLYSGWGGHVDPAHPHPVPRTTAHALMRRDSFGSMVHPTRRGLFCVWEGEADARRFAQRVGDEGGCGQEGWNLILRPISSRGRLHGHDPLAVSDREKYQPTGPVLIATNGSVRWSRLPRLQRENVGPLSEVTSAQGLQKGLSGFTLGRSIQVFTWTRWDDLSSGLRFAYQSAAHPSRIAGERGDRPIFDDTWFARFEIIE